MGGLTRRRMGQILASAAAGIALGSAARAANGRIRLAIQKTGTVAWELDVIRANGLDAKNGLDLAVTELATTEAGKIAVRGGSADVMVSDWLWVSRERTLGTPMQFVPYSASVGALVVPADSPVRGYADLRGKKLSVAGGALDKSWLLVRAAAQREGVDLRKECDISFGAPPLLFEKMLQKEHDASLNYWNFAARLETKGFRRLVAVEEAAAAMGAAGGVSMLGYVFEETWARANGDTLARFLAAARQAKQILETSDAEWDRIRPLTLAPDDASFAAYRRRYRDGIPRRSVEAEEADARRLYAVMAEYGGVDLVGPAKELDAGTYYRAPKAI
jgi:NitT/TauT family transport system substrate-binding protein